MSHTAKHPVGKITEDLTENMAALDKLNEEGFTPDEANTVLRLQGVIIGLKKALRHLGVEV